MKITVTDRLTIELCLLQSDFSDLANGNFALISIHSGMYGPSPGPVIRSPSDEKKFRKAGGMDLIQLLFLDLNESVKSDPLLFNTAQAKEIIAFVDKIQGTVKNLIIHCDAGVSRSGSVGVWTVLYLKQDAKKFRARYPDIQPNGHVLKTLMTESGLKRPYQDFWERPWEI